MDKIYCFGCMEPVSSEDAKCQCGFTAENYEVDAHQLRPGTILKERYQVGVVLGEGGFGITYVGRDSVLDLKVAIKEFYMSGYVNRNNTYSTMVRASVGSHSELFERNKDKFLTEARVLAKFANEEGIVGIRDFFQENNTAYIVMDFLTGETLRDYLKEKKKIAWEETLRIMSPLISSLGTIHKHNVIHRDISPDNIMLTTDGKVKLLDFGAAREVSQTDIKSLSVILKPGYAPEEQYRSKGQQGPWTDVYALCATMYCCISGVVPEDSMERMFEDKLKRLHEIEPNCSVALSDVIARGMAVRQKDRYQSIAELQEDLEKARKNPQGEGFGKRNVESASVDSADKSLVGNAVDANATVYAAEIKDEKIDTNATVYAAEIKDAKLDTNATVYAAEIKDEKSDDNQLINKNEAIRTNKKESVESLDKDDSIEKKETSENINIQKTGSGISNKGATDRINDVAINGKKEKSELNTTRNKKLSEQDKNDNKSAPIKERKKGKKTIKIIAVSAISVVALVLLLICLPIISFAVDVIKALVKEPDTTVVSENPSTQNETTVTSEKPSTANKGAMSIPENFDDYVITINDVVIQLPATYQTFVDAGWEAADPALFSAKELEPYSASSIEELINITECYGSINVCLANYSGSVKSLDECWVYSVEVIRWKLYEGLYDGAKEHDIVLGATTISFKDTDLSYMKQYYKDYSVDFWDSKDYRFGESGSWGREDNVTDGCYKFSFADDQLMKSVSVACYNEPDSFVDSYEKEAPRFDQSAFEKEVAPPSSIHVTRGDGTSYELKTGVKIKEYLEQGWKIPGLPEYMPAGDLRSGLTMIVDARTSYSIEIVNPYNVSVATEECIVSSLVFDSSEMLSDETWTLHFEGTDEDMVFESTTVQNDLCNALSEQLKLNYSLNGIFIEIKYNDDYSGSFMELQYSAGGDRIYKIEYHINQASLEDFFDAQ